MFLMQSIFIGDYKTLCRWIRKFTCIITGLIVAEPDLPILVSIDTSPLTLTTLYLLTASKATLLVPW